MNNTQKASFLKLANREFRAGNFTEAITLYTKAKLENPELGDIADFSISLSQRSIRDDSTATSNDAETLSVVKEKTSPSSVPEGNNELINENKNSILTQNFESFSISEILVSSLETSCKRLLKEYDIKRENVFLEKFKSAPLEIKKQSRKFFCSIIMPTYNRAATLSKAIDSVISQTHKLWELIIIDDGSTDNTAQVLKKYKKDKRIKVIKGEHKGVSAARNLGLSASTGDYIYYLDSDNSWKENLLEIMNFSFLVSGRETGYCSLLLHDEHDSVIGYRGEAFDWEECLKANYVDINVFAHKRSLLVNQGPYDISLRRMVDWDLILRYTKISPPFFAPFIGCYYLESRNDINRITLSEPLAFQKVVRLKNTLEDSDKISISKLLSLNIAIKIPAPVAEKDQWGDYHYADSLRVALEKLGHNVALDFHGAWHSRPPSKEDVVIVIRGLTSYKPRKGAISIMWNISHPDQISVDEYESYDIVYVASHSYAEFLKTHIEGKVSPLLQCSDPERFTYKRPVKPRIDSMLFVGNSRNEYRPIVRKAIESGKDIAIYGARWEKLVDSKYVKANNIANTELCAKYAAHSIVLNDHWESMRDFGFISNRVFDVVASGSTLITDPIPSINKIFGESVVQLEEKLGFDSVTRTLENIQDSGEHRKRDLAEFVNKHHSFNNRAHVICDDILQKLGLPPVWSTDIGVDAGDISFGSNKPRVRIGILRQQDANFTHSEFIRLISPLTTEIAHQNYNVVILNEVNTDQLAGLKFVIIQGHVLKTKAAATELVSLSEKLAIKIYLDIDKDYLSTTYRQITSGQRSALKYLTMKAHHVWFANQRLALIYRGICNSSSVINSTLDKRLWRNYRAPQPTPALVPNYRLLLLTKNKSADDLELIISALDIVAKERGNNFQLVMIGELDSAPTRPWLKHIKPNEKRSVYHRFSEWLIKAERFDIGLVPKFDDPQDVSIDDDDFLHMTALGVPVISSKSWAYEPHINSSLIFPAANTPEKWAIAITTAMDHRELMINMADRAWRYVWANRTADSSALKLICDLDKAHKPAESAHKVKPITTGGKVAVCIHLYYIEQWKNISKQLLNIPEKFDLYLTCPTDSIKSVQELVLPQFSDATIVPVQNSGMDVLPFLIVNKEHSLWRYAAVLKLHTKNTKTPDDLIFGRLCYESLLSSDASVSEIISKLTTNTNVGVIGPETLYRSAKSLMYVNGPMTQDLYSCLDQEFPKQDWGFFAGTMFWIRGTLLFTLADKFIELTKLIELDTSVAKSGGDGTWAHAMERLFGALPVMNGLQNQALFLSNTTDRQWSIREITAGEFQKHLSYRVSSKWHMGRFANVSRWAQLCLDSGLFDENYYMNHYHSVVPKGMSAIVHYILYGDDLLFNPSEKFSTAYYKARHPDTISARVPFLVHYLACGATEGRSICGANEY